MHGASGVGALSAPDVRCDPTGQCTITLRSPKARGAGLGAYCSFSPIPQAQWPYNRTDTVSGYIVPVPPSGTVPGAELPGESLSASSTSVLKDASPATWCVNHPYKRL
jgi:hypothetical protein